jgi:hypothetical protein
MKLTTMCEQWIAISDCTIRALASEASPRADAIDT